MLALLIVLLGFVVIASVFGIVTALKVALIVLAVVALAVVVGVLVLRHLLRTRGPVFLAAFLARRFVGGRAATLLAGLAARHLTRRRRPTP